MSAILELTIFPLNKTGSLSPYVARAVGCIKESGLPYVFTPMSTSIEGEWNELLALATRCFEALKTDCDRIHVLMRLDWRDGPGGRLESKVQSVERILAQKAG